MSIINQSLICNNFGGIKRIQSAFSSALITASDLQNVELFDTGVNSGVGIRSMLGNKAIFSLPFENEKIINIFESVQDSQKYCFVYAESESEGKIYLYDIVSNELTLKVQNLSVTGYASAVDFAQGWKDLFIFTNGKEMLSINLNNYDSDGNLDEIKFISPVDVDGNQIYGIGLSVFDGRLWLFNGVRLYYSVKENCYDFSTASFGIVTSAGYIECAKKISAIIPYLGTLAVFHKDSSCLISINSDYSYSMTEESPGGCAATNSLVFHGNQLFFYDDSKKSVFAFSQIINGDKTLVDNIAKDVQEELFNLETSLLNEIKIVSVIQSERNEIWFILPDKDVNFSTILIYDYIHSQWLKRKSQKIVSAIILNDTLYSFSDKKIFLEYNGENFDGEFIQSFYTCSPLNLFADNTVKMMYIPPRLTLDMTKSNDFSVKYTRNYDSISKVKEKKITAKTIKNVMYWDSSFWDSDAIFKPRETNSIIRIPTSSFKSLEIMFYTSESPSPTGFAIKNIEMSQIKVKQV